MIRRTYSAKPGEIAREWRLVDVSGEPLGRVATQIAMLLRGKHKPQFTPHVDTGDFVVAINAGQIRLTGNKLLQKRYYRHSGYPGGIRSLSAQELMQRAPGDVLKHAVRGMLPKNSLGRNLLKKLKIYDGAEHPHSAQAPHPFPLKKQHSS